MGKTRDNLFADGFTGKMGKNMVFRQKKSGNVIVAKAPRKTRNALKASSALVRAIFKQGVGYAISITRNAGNAALKARYEAAIKGDQSAYNLALRDACVPPKVTLIKALEYAGVIGNKITVQAEDDFSVESVNVSIRAGNGELIEEGAAILDIKGINWVYTTTVANDQLAGSVITATAADIPGNTGSLEITV
jgi:hypothetical protein